MQITLAGMWTFMGNPSMHYAKILDQLSSGTIHIHPRQDGSLWPNTTQISLSLLLAPNQLHRQMCPGHPHRWHRSYHAPLAFTFLSAFFCLAWRFLWCPTISLHSSGGLVNCDLIYHNKIHWCYITPETGWSLSSHLVAHRYLIVDQWHLLIHVG